MARDCYDDCIAFLDEQLGRLLDELERQGLLANTDVIITSDHGEAFGEHGGFGHNTSVHLDETGVPLVIVSPTAPAGRVVDSPVTLRDLPATVVDQLGLTAGSSFPGRSLAAFWQLPHEQEAPKIASPVFSEQAIAAAFQAQPTNSHGHLGFEMSLVAAGWHYIRDGTGAERLHDLRIDPYELDNLVDRAQGTETVKRFRRLLLRVLTDNPGSIEVEKAYLKTFRQSLKSLVEERAPTSVSAVATQSIDQRPRTFDQ
jgi:arylsulfatase A-like enzyme